MGNELLKRTAVRAKSALADLRFNLLHEEGKGQRSDLVRLDDAGIRKTASEDLLRALTSLNDLLALLSQIP